MSDDNDPLLEAVQVALFAFFQADTPEEEKAVFREYPELLYDEMDIVFEDMIANARKKGAKKVEQLFTRRYQRLKANRPRLKKWLAEQPVNPSRPKNAIQQALDAEDQALASDPNTIPMPLFPPIWDYLNVTNPEEEMAVLEKHPGLLDESNDQFFELFIADVRKMGEGQTADVFAERLEHLRYIRREVQKLGKIFQPYLFHTH